MLRDSDVRTFGNRLSAATISVIRAPEDLAGWEHALRSGRVEKATAPVVQAVEPPRREPGPPWPPDPSAFPLAVMNHQERSPYTTVTHLSPGQEVLLLIRDGVTAFPPETAPEPVGADTA